MRVAQHDECSKGHCIVHVKMFKMAHSCIFCHNTRKLGIRWPWPPPEEALGKRGGARPAVAALSPALSAGVWQIQGYLKHLKAIVQYKEKVQTQLQNLYSVGPCGRTGWGGEPRPARRVEVSAGGPRLSPRQPSPPHRLRLSLPQWGAFMELADSIPDSVLDQVIDSQKPNQCCALIYRLVATGPPKAIMLSHDNVSGPPAEAGRAPGRCSACHVDPSELLGAENQTACR